METIMSFSKTTQEVGKLFATAKGNWDYYAVEHIDNKKSPYCYSVAKEGKSE